MTPPKSQKTARNEEVVTITNATSNDPRRESQGVLDYNLCLNHVALTMWWSTGPILPPRAVVLRA
jgi:hypothetical protein